MRNRLIEEDLKAIVSSDLNFDVFRDKTFLITGANGFIPAYMVEVLLYLNECKRLNIKVLALVRNRVRGEGRFRYYRGRNDLQFVIHDFTTELKIEGAVDYIIHAASQASPKYYGIDPVGTLTPNVFGTQKLLELARGKKSEKFLFFSSGDVYGELDPSQIPTPETSYGYLDPTKIRSCYGESKRMGETLCSCWNGQFGIHTLIVRPFHTYGPGMRLDDGRVFCDFVADILAGRDIVMRSEGNARRAFCYLGEAVAAYFTVLLKGKAAQAYNVGNPFAEASIRELAELLASMGRGQKVIQFNRVSTSGYLESPVSRFSPDIQKIQQLGWSPKMGLQEGFQRTLDAMKL